MAGDADAKKRKADGAAAGAGGAKKPAAAASAAALPLAVDPRRVRVLSGGAKPAPGGGPVLYWMSRDQRARDNWALLHACAQAKASGAPVAVAFCLVPAFLGAGARQFGFMLRGLRELAPRLAGLGVPFFLLRGDPGAEVPRLAAAARAALVVTDYSPLRLGRAWRAAAAEALAKAGVPLHEVDAHNVVPVWEASDKREYAARTLRPKLHARLPEFLREFPAVPDFTAAPGWPRGAPAPPAVDWDGLLAEVAARGAAVPEVSWAAPGEDAAAAALADFLTPARLAKYAAKRNDPAVPDALSGLSPWLHFGQLAPARAAIAAGRHRAGPHRASVDGFLEELVVRRELADNYCHHCPDSYDSLDAAYDWARDSLAAHAGDKREFVYTLEQFEAAATHDALWNAAQREMVATGKMHGFMRMYWAKKILEWSASPAEAVRIGIALNDRWSLDGRDPSGYVGVLWSVAGIHDMGWAERPVFGKIRYMNLAGCKRKFDVDAYIARVDRLVAAAGGGVGPGGKQKTLAGFVVKKEKK